MRRATKDVDAAVERLWRAAAEDGLIAFGGFEYNGSIASDLIAVLRALGTAQWEARQMEKLLMSALAPEQQAKMEELCALKAVRQSIQ